MKYMSGKNCLNLLYNFPGNFEINTGIKEKTSAPGGARTPDLRITSAPSAIHTNTAYKYDALTDCATGAW